MISIIVCSIKPDLLKEFQANVARTVGVDYELIIIDNKVEQLSICEAYNKGASQAQFENLAFCHEDILFHTQNWGEELIKLLNHQQIGLVGIAGATFKSKYPTSWISVPKEYYRSNLFFDDKTQDIKQNDFDEVVVLDGCFLAMSKPVWSQFKFNESLLKGFHLYDIDISVRIKKIFKIVVTNTISLSHLSEGNLDQNWFKQSKLFHDTFKIELPLSIEAVEKNNFLDSYGLRSMIHRSKKLGLPLSVKLKWIMQLLVQCPSLFSYKLFRVLF